MRVQGNGKDTPVKPVQKGMEISRGWGVNVLPPGMTPEDAEHLMRTLSRQQGR